MLPKKKAYNKILEGMDEAAILIQRSYREYRRRRIRGRVRLCLAKFFAAVRFLVLYQTIRRRRELAGVNRIEVDPDEKLKEEDKI